MGAERRWAAAGWRARSAGQQRAVAIGRLVRWLAAGAERTVSEPEQPYPRSAVGQGWAAARPLTETGAGDTAGVLNGGSAARAPMTKCGAASDDRRARPSGAIAYSIAAHAAAVLDAP